MIKNGQTLIDSRGGIEIRKLTQMPRLTRMIDGQRHRIRQPGKPLRVSYFVWENNKMNDQEFTTLKSARDYLGWEVKPKKAA